MQQTVEQKTSQKIRHAWVLGASGYAGAELCRLITRHRGLHLARAFSSDSTNSGALCALYPALLGVVNIELQAWSDSYVSEVTNTDIVFLALPHEASLNLVPLLLKQGCCVIDLSAAFRLLNVNNYPSFYGFDHSHPELLQERVYALTGEAGTSTASASSGQESHAWCSKSLLSMPGCYPTAATLALLPLINAQLLAPQQMPVITAVSGVSGAGRKANLATSFCEVSLRPYGVLEHRHQCEIEQNLGQEVMFVPQLGNFKRGIVAICAARLKPGVSQQQADRVFADSYKHSSSVRLRQTPPQIDDVATTPFCDIHVKVTGTKVVVVAALDNLLKGAASQSIEAFNLKFSYPPMEGLL